MDKQFDELSKSLAEGVSRREAVRKFGIVLAGALLAAVGLTSGEEASANSDLQCCHYIVAGGHKFTFNLCQASDIACQPSIIAGEVYYRLKNSRKVRSCDYCS